MKKLSEKKPLRLATETVRDLRDVSLSTVAGASSGFYNCNISAGGSCRVICNQ